MGKPILLIVFLTFLSACTTSADRKAAEENAKLIADRAMDDYADCGFDVATAYARKNFLPQDIADAAIGECSIKLGAYREAHYQHMLSLTSGSMKARSTILENMPDHLTRVQAGLRNAVISRVLEVRSASPK